VSSSFRSADTAHLNRDRSTDPDPTVVSTDDDATTARGKRVSVIVPTHESGATLDACLRSIREQNVPVELIVVDNGSKDDTPTIASRYADRVIRSGPERSAQRNAGARIATGTSLLFVDSDMVLPPELAEAVVARFDAAPDIQALVVPERSAGRGYWARCKVLEKEIYVGDRSVEAARAFRRGAFRDSGGFDEDLFAGEDWDLADRVDPTGESTDRVEPVIVHDEGRLTLREDLRKKLYYGRSLRRYLAKPGTKATDRLLRLAFLRRLPALLRDPIHAIGLLMMKALELLAVIVGMLLSFVRRGQTGPIDPVRRRLVLTFALPMIIGLFAVQTWFQAGTFIASGDVAPFIRDDVSAEGFSLWSHTLTGAGSASFQSAARLPELVVIDAAHMVGASNQTAQRIFYTLIVLAVIASAIYFVLAFIPPGFAAGLAGLVVLFNPYVLQNLPNPLPLWTLALMATAGGLVLRVAQGKSRSVFSLVSMSLFACYLALNPPLLVVSAAWVVLMALMGSLVAGEGGTRRALVYVLRAFPWVALVNLWWIVPYALTVHSVGSGFGITAQTDVQAWAWTQARDSIPNVLTLSGKWGWRYPEYFPYASTLDRGAWASLKFGLPALALLAFPFAPPGRRRIPATFIGLVVVLTFLSKGLHPPFSGANLFLYDHVPGFWLFREPLSKFGPALVLCYVLLIGIALNGVAKMGHEVADYAGRTARGVTTAIAIGVLIYPAPLWSGEVIPDVRPLFPSEHVQVPEAWQRLAAFVNDSPAPGKSLVLPLDDYYQMPTTWGYYGADSIPRSLLTRPTIQPLPGGYYGELPGYSGLVESVETALAEGDVAALPPLLRALNVSFVIVRDDLDQAFASRPMPDPTPIENTLVSAPGLDLAGDFGVAHLYQVEGSLAPVSAVGSAVLGSNLSSNDVPLVIGSTSGVAIVSAGDSGTKVGSAQVVAPLDPSRSIGLLSGNTTLAIRAVEPQVFAASTSRSAEGVSLELRPLSEVHIGSEQVVPSTLKSFDVSGSSPVSAIGVDGHIVPTKRGSAILGIPSNSTVTAYASSQEPLSTRRLQHVGDCNRYDNRATANTGLRAEALPNQPGPAVHLQARLHTACVPLRMTQFTPAEPYLVRFDYRTLSGRVARVCLFEIGPNICAAIPPLAASGDWRSYTAAMVPDPGTTGMKLVLYADGGRDPDTTAVDYRAISASRLKPVGSKDLHLAPPPAASFVLSRDSGSLVLPTPTQSGFASTLSTVTDCNAYDSRTPEEVGIGSQGLDKVNGLSVRLQATDHAACVSSAVRGFVPGASYVLDLQYRSVIGRRARICLWQAGPDTCAVLPPMEQSTGWLSYQTTVRPPPGTQGLRLYLYADGDGGKQTILEYRDVEIHVAPAFGAVLVQAPTQSDPSPSVTWNQEGQSVYQVHIDSTDQPFLLVLRESFSNGWQLQGLPSSRVAGHVTVDGYANGWWIEPGSAVAFTITYGPGGWASKARFVSMVGLGLMLAVAMKRRRSRRLPSRGEVSGSPTLDREPIDVEIPSHTSNA
jgi:arabinofuranan 3-O-arabinosyltransferase